MFKNLLNLKYQRSGKEAIEFYIAYLTCFGLAALILPAIISLNTNGTIIFLFTNEEFMQKLAIFGKIIAIIFNITLLVVIILKKNLSLFHKNTVFLFIATLYFTFLSGLILGLVPISYLTMVEKRN